MNLQGMTCDFDKASYQVAPDGMLREGILEAPSLVQ